MVKIVTIFLFNHNKCVSTFYFSSNGQHGQLYIVHSLLFPTRAHQRTPNRCSVVFCKYTKVQKVMLGYQGGMSYIICRHSGILHFHPVLQYRKLPQRWQCPQDSGVSPPLSISRKIPKIILYQYLQTHYRLAPLVLACKPYIQPSLF